MKKILLKTQANFLKNFLSLLLLCSFCLGSQVLENDSLRLYKRTVYLSDNPKLTDLDLLVDSLVRGVMQSPENCGLSIGITTGNKNYFYNYGETQRGSRKIPAKHTVYEIGSVSTTFCGLILAYAVKEGRVGLEDDIRKYLPGNYSDLIYAKAPIRVKHLVNHTSGLPLIPENLLQQEGYDSLNPYKHYKRQQIFDYLKVVKLKKQPGLTCEYSNLGIALLGIILEGIYSKSFEDLVNEKICTPAQMKSSFIFATYLQKDVMAQGYNENGEVTPAWELGGFASAGGIHSSAEDMLLYLDLQFSETDPAINLAHQPTFVGRQTLAFAWFIKRTNYGNTLYWHNGATFGFRSFCGFVKEKNCSVVVLSNSARDLDYIGIRILNQLQQ